VLSQLVEAVAGFVERIVNAFGAPGVTLIALLENLFPPTPSETLYPLAGKLAFSGMISIPAIVIAGTFGSLVGSWVYYFLGYRLGEDGSRRLISRFGTLHLLRLKIPIISLDDYERGLRLFQRYGGIIVFIARLMPLVHGVVSIPAGVVRMNAVRFSFYTALGAALWIAPLTVFGYWLGDNWEDVLGWIDFYQNAILLLAAGLVAVIVIRRLLANRQTLKS
jgi:membrane protein DedA with SNARE-associated domain